MQSRDINSSEHVFCATCIGARMTKTNSTHAHVTIVIVLVFYRPYLFKFTNLALCQTD